MKILRTAAVVAAAFWTMKAVGAPANDPFRENVRTTEPLTAEQELKTFHLPLGFEIQLVASEPAIGKPFNIAFDAKGRLWVTVSKEYPFPAKSGHGAMDRILVLEDFDENGHARKISTFADNLDIPIGIYPYQDGCLAYSIPYISAYHDTNGDGKVDRIDHLYGPFSYDRDTHGMTNNFRRGFDGWLYATHGFNNLSNPKSIKTGQGITMHSGNTYRMKLDGSQIEQFTWGQTNPFGFAFDPLGFAYSSECELMPVSQLIRGGYFEGLGKTHDGLGFAPRFINHMHGSTAIAGLFLCNDDSWPAEYRDNVFIGNVVTCKLNRDSLHYHGASPDGKLEPDFLSTDDPWFRPVAMQMATDGSVFIGDFYNRIIGHYEVPLTHPGRDHEHGRIWRIVYRGADGKKSAAPAIKDQTAENVDQLINDLASGNFPTRMFATDQLSDRIGTACVEPIKAMIGKTQNPWQKSHGLWVLYRLNALEPAILDAAAKDPAMPVRIHAMHILAETLHWSAEQKGLALAALNDSEPLVTRVAADALGQHPAYDQVKPLLDLCRRCAPDDTFLMYQARVALRDHLKQDDLFKRVTEEKLDAVDADRIDGVALAVPSEISGKYLADRLAAHAVAAGNTVPAMKHAARYAPMGDVDRMADAYRSDESKKIDQEANEFRAVLEGLGERGVTPDAKLVEWGTRLAGQLLSVSGDAAGQQVGADIAKAMKLDDLTPQLEKLATNKKAQPAARIAAVKAMMSMHPAELPASLATIVGDLKEPLNLREAVVQSIGEAHEPHAFEAAIKAVNAAPYRLQNKLALSMASSPQGAEMLLGAIKEGKLTPRLLQEGGTQQRLFAANLPEMKERIAALTKGLPPADAAVQHLIDQRAADYRKAAHSAEEGAKIFAKNCSICHTMEGQGGKVGPTLDGIGNRGVDRLCEDVLDPSRNVDPAFRYISIKLKDGTIVDGLQRREEGAVLIFVDATGKELQVPKDQIASRRDTNLSLMPSNFGELLSEKDFFDLMAYLLSKQAAR